MKDKELEEVNATLQCIKDIFNDEKVLYCLQQFNNGKSVHKIVYAGAAIKYLTHLCKDVNEILNLFHAVLAVDVLSKYQ